MCSKACRRDLHQSFQGRGCVLLPLLLMLVLHGATRVQSQARSQQRNNPQEKPPSFNSWAAGPYNCSCAQELSQLKKDMEAGKRQRQEMQGSLETYVSELHDLKAMVRSLRNDDGIPRTPRADKYNANGVVQDVMKHPSISFSAKLSYNRELKPLDSVVFDTVITNNGQAYNAQTGKFTAPLPGTYVFFVTILSGYNTKVETALILNDKEVARMYSGAHDAHGSGSNAAILNLKGGDNVWVRLLYQGGNHVHGYYSTMAGALLSQEEGELK